jgi:hypothetical protein
LESDGAINLRLAEDLGESERDYRRDDANQHPAKQETANHDRRSRADGDHHGRIRGYTSLRSKMSRLAPLPRNRSQSMSISPLKTDQGKSSPYRNGNWTNFERKGDV